MKKELLATRLDNGDEIYSVQIKGIYVNSRSEDMSDYWTSEELAGESEPSLAIDHEEDIERIINVANDTTAYVCTNDELLWDGQEDEHGEMIDLQIAPEISIAPLQSYCDKKGIELVCSNVFSEWQGGIHSGKRLVYTKNNVSLIYDNELNDLLNTEINVSLDRYNKSLI